MAYAIKYLFKFESSNGTTREIRVLQDGYTGEVIQRPLGRAPILKKQQNGPVHGTSLEFYAECNVDREFIEFYTSDPKAYRVDLYAGATLLWQGYITPELYSEPDIAPPYDVQVVATDGVGELKLYDYAAQGAVTLRALLSGLLARTGLGTDIYLISSLKAGSRGAGALLDMTINLDYMAGRTCYEVLTYILDTLHATITWWKGAWILTRETNVTFTNGKVRYFNTASNSALLNDSVQVLGTLRANPAWPVGQLSTVIDPAKNRVTVQAPWHVVTCLRNSDMGSDADWTKAKNARYETDGYVLPININTGTSETAVISQATSMAGLRVPMNLSVKATGATSEISAQVTGAVLGVLLTYKVGNVTYHLVKGDDGAPVWQQGSDIGTYIPLRTRIDFQQQLATWDSSRIEAEELSIDNIPPFLQGTTFPAGTLTVYILGYCAKIYGAHLDVILPKGYQDILRIDNGARGEGGEVEVAIGHETTDNAYYAAFLQGLLLDSGNLITSFSDANFPGGMDYLAFIARDYALSVALPRAKVTGTVYLESGIAAPPLVFTKGALNYWLQTWSWNLYEDELELEGLTLPSASLTVESETILESNGSTVSSAGGAGSSSAGSSIGGGTNYWEIDGTLNTLLKPKPAYSYLGVKDGIFFEGATQADFEVVTVAGVGRVIHSRLPFYSDGFVSAGGLSSGGGSEGASLAAVWASLKTNSDDYANEKINVAHIPALASLSGNLTVSRISDIETWISGKGYLTDHQSLDGYVNALTRTPASGGNYVSAVTKSGKTITVTYATLPTSLKNPYALTFGSKTYNGSKAKTITASDLGALTSHQTVTLVSGTNNGTLKLTTAAGTTDNIAVKGLGSMAYKSSLSASDIPTLAISKISGLQDALDAKADASSLASYVQKAGDTITGSITFNETSYDATVPFVRNITNTGGWSRGVVDFQIEGTTVFRIGASGNGSSLNYGYIYTAGNDALRFYADGSLAFGNNTIWHAGNSNLSTVAWSASTLTAATSVTAPRFYLNASTYFELDSDGYVHLVHPTGKGLYVDGFISAGGVSSGGGTSGVDLTAVWNNLVANTGEGLNKKIHTAHLPTVTITGTNISGTATYSGTGGSASTLTLNLTAVDTKYTNGTGISLSGTTFSLDVAGAKTALGLGSNAYTSTAYLPLAGGKTTGAIWRKMTADTSNYENAIGWQNAAGSSTLAYIGYHNTVQKIYINAIGASEVSTDTVGKYSLVVGNNVLTYNTYPILHSNNYTTYVNTTNFPGLNNVGTVTSVAMTVPTGLSVSGTPITTSGTLAISLASGYSIPTTAKQTAWDGKQDAIGDLSTIRNNASDGAAAYNALGNYVLKSGDTMTGPLSISHTYANDAHLRYIDTRVKAGGGGWSDSILSIHDAAESSKAELGWAGNNEAPSRLYLGLSGGSYLNIYSDNIQFGSNDIYHHGNANLSTVAWACSTLTASGNASCASLSVGSNMSVTGTGTTITGGSKSSNSRAVEVTQVSSGSWPVSMLVMTPNLPANGTHAFMIGRTNASGNSGSLSFRYVGNASTANSFSLGFHSNDFVINAFYSGNVTIGTGNTTDYGQRLYVAGNIVATGAITAGAASDARLKTNISTLSDSDAKALIMALRPVTFTWNDKATELYDQYKGDDLGMIAQEVEPYLPQAVGTIFEKYKRLDYTKVISPLVKVVQDHESRIRQLEAENRELRKEVERLRMN